MKTSTYEKIRHEIKPGDVFAFGGRGVVSAVIKKATNSPVSHVGIVPFITELGSAKVVQLIESTTMEDGKSGVEIRRLSTKVAKYDGEVWWLPLKHPIPYPIQWSAEMVMQRGKDYDAPQAIMSALDRVPDTNEDLSKLFCSELVTYGLRLAGFVDKGINASEQTPADVCMFNCFNEPIQIKGVAIEIK